MLPFCHAYWLPIFDLSLQACQSRKQLQNYICLLVGYENPADLRNQVYLLSEFWKIWTLISSLLNITNISNWSDQTYNPSCKSLFFVTMLLLQDVVGGYSISSVLHQCSHLLSVPSISADRQTAPEDRVLPDHLPRQERLHAPGDGGRYPGPGDVDTRDTGHGGIQE